MSPADTPPPVLRDDLLEGVRIVIAGPQDADAEPGASVGAVCMSAGARVAGCRPPDGFDIAEQEAAAESVVSAALAELDAGADMLVVDAGALLAAPGGSLGGCLQTTWNVARAVANQALIGAGGRIVLLAPAPGGGEHAAAALAGLENLARTLSIEWARHSVTCVAIAPGERTQPAQLAELVAYLASAAGAYFSGCLLDLRGQVA